MQWPYGVKPLILLRLTLADCHEISSAPGGWTSSTAPAGKCPETRGLQGVRTRPWRCRRPVAPRTGRIALKPYLTCSDCDSAQFQSHSRECAHTRVRTRELVDSAGCSLDRQGQYRAARQCQLRHEPVLCGICQ